MEATTFGYHLTYLLGNSPVHSPVLHALGLGMARISASDMVRAHACLCLSQACMCAFRPPSRKLLLLLPGACALLLDLRACWPLMSSLRCYMP